MNLKKRSLLEKLRQPYLSYMVDVAVMMGANRSRAEIEMNDALSFEAELLNVRSKLGFPVDCKMSVNFF